MTAGLAAARPRPAGVARDPLAIFDAVDLLEVGPVEIQPRSLRTRYRAVRGLVNEVFELSFRFDDKVFEAGDLADQSLGAMIAAQPAVNYGLFCRRMHFHGAYAEADQQLLRVMLAKTAREIYVKRFLQPHPWLVPEARSLPALHRADYYRAEVTFSPAVGPTAPWTVDRGRYAVLSAGDGDSLLSHALLSELGVPSHPILVEESGRGGLAARAAWQHFRGHEVPAARVRTNCGDLFDWMLHLLPFVRRPADRAGEDPAPFGLWTAAVYLFAALPLLRRRGLGRLVAGGDHEATVRTAHEGILHYDGLYDRSRYFDRAMTRYFQLKGWGVTQLSLSRPFSELLTAATLAAHHPRLLALQATCRAARGKGGRIVPCGRCERCRRTVGLLAAVDADPEGCGYPVATQRRLLAELCRQGVAMERPLLEHLAYLLAGRGLIPEPHVGQAPAASHPEVMMLRFDPERSPLREIPARLRRPLLELFEEAGTGMVCRQGSEWVELELDEDESRPDRWRSWTATRPAE